MGSLHPGYSPGLYIESELIFIAAAYPIASWCEQALTGLTFLSLEVELRWCGIREKGQVFGSCTEGIIHTLVHCMQEETHWAYELGFIRSRHKAMSVTAGVQTLCNHTSSDSQADTNTHIHSYNNISLSHCRYCEWKPCVSNFSDNLCFYIGYRTTEEMIL